MISRRAAAAVLGCAATLIALTAAPAATAAPAGGRTLYVTNGDSNDISIFTIGATGGLTLAGKPTPTDAQPRGIVFAPSGDTAYVAGSGTNSVSAYRVGADGGLTPLASYPTGGNLPFGIAITPDGTALYVSNINDGTLTAFGVNGDGTLRRLGDPLTGVDSPNGLAVTPDGRFLFVSHGTPNVGVPATITVFAIGGDGTLTPHGGAVPVPTGSVAIVITPDGRYLYIAARVLETGPETSLVSGFRIGPDATLDPVPGSPVPAPAFPDDATMAPDGRHLYVATADTNDVHSFSIGSDGALTDVGRTFPADKEPVGMTPTPDGRHLYVANRNSHNVSAFDIEADGGLGKIDDFNTKGRGSLFHSVAVRPDQGPTASFTARPGRTAAFDATASSDPDGGVARYDWDFGDGTGQADAGPTPSHIYPGPGTYRVTLTVTDDEGCSTRQIFTGQSALCNGSAAAATATALTIP